MHIHIAQAIRASERFLPMKHLNERKKKKKLRVRQKIISSFFFSLFLSLSLTLTCFFPAVSRQSEANDNYPKCLLCSVNSLIKPSLGFHFTITVIINPVAQVATKVNHIASFIWETTCQQLQLLHTFLDTEMI